ncbi:MAG: hypothetical protein RMI90_15375, partial [Thermoguttaceae bacterium]|nr:hypothetical protein [Thermoguttaceae bacterium]
VAQGSWQEHLVHKMGQLVQSLPANLEDFPQAEQRIRELFVGWSLRRWRDGQGRPRELSSPRRPVVSVEVGSVFKGGQISSGTSA